MCPLITFLQRPPRTHLFSLDVFDNSTSVSEIITYFAKKENELLNIKSLCETGVLVQFKDYSFICSELICEQGNMTVVQPFFFSDRQKFNNSFSTPGTDGSYRAFSHAMENVVSIDVFTDAKLLLIFDYKESIYECFCEGIEHHHDLFWLIKPSNKYSLFGNGKEIQIKNEYYKKDIERNYNKEAYMYSEDPNGVRIYITTLYTATDANIIAIPKTLFTSTLRTIDFQSNQYPNNEHKIESSFFSLNKENSIEVERTEKMVKVVTKGISWGKARDSDFKSHTYPVKFITQTTFTRKFTALVQAIQYNNKLIEQTKNLNSTITLIGFSKSERTETEEFPD